MTKALTKLRLNSKFKNRDENRKENMESVLIKNINTVENFRGIKENYLKV